ncbi:unnamed protein product [Brassicogethes aeneus]|uniref:Mini-chromosome maintenance complex-binding protein n=1 Tax=Brassicogethes aeneus TaxID=1431903 RepID=A0A9P0AYA7_BRAAE|nr:unnamed protein product [Brassicogethes aeneus]
MSCTLEILINNEEEWLKKLENEDFWNSIPLLNVNEVHNIKNLSLVRFKGMIQDMQNPEYYLEKYEVTNRDTNEKYVKNGKYSDVILQSDNEDVDYDNENNKTSERQTYVVISTPGVNKWVDSLEEEFNKCKSDVNEVEHIKTDKRSLEDEEMETEVVKNSELYKKQCTEEKIEATSSDKGNSSVVSKEHILNFPLPDRMGKKCHVKVYDETNTLKLNDTVEIVGFLSCNPFLATINEEEDESRMEIESSHPPASIVPRIHCVKYKKIIHLNPLVTSQNLTSERMLFLKKELMILFTQLLLGDDLAADYLICNLISDVYLRKDFMPLGKFSINITNIPIMQKIDYTKTLYEFIEMLVPKSHYFPMTLENLNDQTFIPKKDYDCNRLTSGILQLSKNTHFILDETKLTDGKLNAAGVNNIKAIASCIKNQKIAYDFNYYPIEYEVDIPFLILSEGKSMLTPDVHITLQPDETCLRTFSEIVEAAKQFLNNDLLNELRVYLTFARLIKYEISDKIQDLVQQEFVNMRQKEKNISADNLHNLLVLARLVCISEGKSTLDEHCWKKALHMEEIRKSRLPAHT